LGDEIGKIRLRHECFGPQALLQRRLGHHFRALEDERRQQLERFGRQVLLAAVPRQLPGVEIEGEWAEANSHSSGPLRKTCGMPGCPLRLCSNRSLSYFTCSPLPVSSRHRGC